MKTYKTMNVEKAMIQVTLFHLTANDLQNGANSVVKDLPGGSTDAGLMARPTGYLFSAVILRALAAEIMLKVLSFKKTGQYRGGHDLKKLFDKLHDDTKKIIIDLGQRRGVVSLEQTLEKHKDDFVEWRYMMEAGDQNTNLLDLKQVLNILLEVYQHKDFSGSP